MSYYENLKRILEERELTSYQIEKKYGIKSQTIDYAIKNKVTSPKPELLNRISKALGISENELMYGTNCFIFEDFQSVLESKGKTIEDLVIDADADGAMLLDAIIPPEDQQKRIAEYLGVKISDLFKPSTFAKDYFRAQRIKPYVRPDINSEPQTDKDMMKLYSKLSPIAKRLVYNMAYDLAVVETENVVTFKRKDYWEKKDKI